jgi:hypothetical protein
MAWIELHENQFANSTPESNMRSRITQLLSWLKGASNARGWMHPLVRKHRGAAEHNARRQTETLTQVIDTLALLNRNTERDFLNIGSKLFDFIKSIDLISSDLTELAKSQNEARASQALSDTLACSLKMKERYSRHAGGLDRLHREAGGVKNTLSGFHCTVLTFDALRFLTQIELARLGGSGAQFGNLPEEMKSVAENVRVRVASALEIADSLLPSLKDAIHEASAIEEGQANDLPAIISDALASLSSLRAMQDAAYNSTVRLRARYNAMSDAFKTLIVSIQFHDITRQQVEHVIQALSRILSGHSGNDGMAVDESGNSAILNLQASQLADAGHKFAASVASISRSLEDIEQHIAAMAEESRMLSGSSLDAKDSVWHDLERGCDAVLASLRKQAQSESSAAAIGTVLTQTIGRMYGSIEEIRAIENQMHLMALNANICAAHIDTSGDVLGSLAGSMQEKSSDIRQRSESLVKALDSMKERVVRLTGRAPSGSSNKTSSQNRCAEEMSLAAAELHSLSERCFALVAQIATRGACLGEELSALRVSFVVGDLFADIVRSAQQKLRSIEENGRSGLSQNRTAAPSLAQFATNYTMQAERDIHDGIINGLSEGTSAGAVSALVESRSHASNELGENVELF